MVFLTLSSWILIGVVSFVILQTGEVQLRWKLLEHIWMKLSRWDQEHSHLFSRICNCHFDRIPKNASSFGCISDSIDSSSAASTLHCAILFPNVTQVACAVSLVVLSLFFSKFLQGQNYLVCDFQAFWSQGLCTFKLLSTPKCFSQKILENRRTYKHICH